MKFIVQDTFSIKKVLIFGGFGLCRFQHKMGMNSFPMRMNVISYGTNSFPWGMYSFRSKIPIVLSAVFGDLEFTYERLICKTHSYGCSIRINALH